MRVCQMFKTKKIVCGFYKNKKKSCSRSHKTFFYFYKKENKYKVGSFVIHDERKIIHNS